MGYYHVVVQSYYGKNILPDEDSCLRYLEIAKRAFQKYHIGWLAYAVMPTHIHLLVEVAAEEELTVLRKARRNITLGYTTYARKERPELLGREKRIFHPTATVKALPTLHDVKQVIRYLHLNPLRKALETTLGESIRSSYSAILAVWEPQDLQNPFNRFWDLESIRDALAIGAVERLFGKNQNEQKQAFLSFHAQPVPEAAQQEPGELIKMKERKKGMFQKAELILKTYFMKNYAFGRRDYNEASRESFLHWLNRRGNPHKAELVLLLRKNTKLTAHEIATFLHIGDTTVKRIVASGKG